MSGHHTKYYFIEYAEGPTKFSHKQALQPNFKSVTFPFLGAVDWVMMQTCYNHNFMLILEKQEKYEGHPQFFAVVQIIGSPKEAKGFAYKLELNGNNKRKLTYEASPRSIHEGVAAAINSSDCLIFDPSIAKLFAENGNLGINVTISQI
jgi:Seven in absentia protein family